MSVVVPFRFRFCNDMMYSAFDALKVLCINVSMHKSLMDQHIDALMHQS